MCLESCVCWGCATKDLTVYLYLKQWQKYLNRTWCICLCMPLFTPLTFLVGYSALCTSHGVSLFECVMLLQSFGSHEVKDVRVIVEGELLSSLAVADNVSKQGQQEHTAVLEGLAGLSECR